MSTYIKFDGHRPFSKRGIDHIKFKIHECVRAYIPFIVLAIIVTMIPVVVYFTRHEGLPDKWEQIDHPTKWDQIASSVLGTGCNAVSGEGCNPHQFPGVSMSGGYVPGHRVWNVGPFDAVGHAGGGLTELSKHTIIDNMVVYSDQVARSFGLNPLDVPVKGALFGDSPDFRETHDAIFTSTTKRLFATTDIAFELFSVSIATGVDGPSPVDIVARALRALPGSIRTGRDLDAYIDFFQVYGTHFVSGVTFGASIHMHSAVDDREVSVRGGSRAQFADGIHATFADTIGLSGEWAHPDAVASAHEFQKLRKDSLIVVNGGNLSWVKNITEWTQSVNIDNALPIKTTLSFIGLLAPTYQRAVLRQAYHSWLDTCPSDTHGQCGGVGVCSSQTSRSRCVCPHGRDGATCQPTDCIGGCVHGFCDASTRKCRCDSNWHGPTCRDRCGSFVYDLPGIKKDGRWFPVNYCCSNGNECGAQSAKCFCQMMHTGTSAIQYRESDSAGRFDSVYACSSERCQSRMWRTCKRFARIECAYPEADCIPNEFTQSIE